MEQNASRKRFLTQDNRI